MEGVGGQPTSASKSASARCSVLAGRQVGMAGVGGSCRWPVQVHCWAGPSRGAPGLFLTTSSLKHPSKSSQQALIIAHRAPISADPGRPCGCGLTASFRLRTHHAYGRITPGSAPSRIALRLPLQLLAAGAARLRTPITPLRPGCTATALGQSRAPIDILQNSLTLNICY